ncbi:ferredoxin reductase [Marinobacter sp. HL-58]|uniref:ferredoxin reductase n=1 Tax=Marinobacter sp. HL-58 TaxID=1479237 RepID=UPI0004893B31|nr:ferredoxin reductase [Marinobacter sp. HL-58]KPP98772.1 MAG: Flavodoxin reductases (ferredoxin-NADPH reductases) family 1 [Marinobacter sp. HL-58]
MIAVLEKSSTLHWLGRQLFNRDDPAAFFDPLLERVNPMWVKQYTPARVAAIYNETSDTKTFVVAPAGRWKGFEAGQHVNISVDIDGVRRNRTFSLSSSPLQWQTDGTVTLTIKRLPGGLVTNWMHDHLEPGAVVGLGDAFGDFRIPNPEEPALYIAGGSGITPVLSQLETMAASDYRSPVTLLYYVRTQADIIAAEKLRALAARWPAFTLKIFTTDESEPQLLCEDHLADVPGLPARRCYLCGPKGLMDLANDLLYRRGISEDRVHSTFFSAPAATLDTDSLGGAVHFERSNLDVSSEGDAVLLEIAEAAKLSPRYGCRMGICHQCSCRKTSGTVVNRLTGKASGPGDESIQLCVSVPRGPVSIDI